MHLWLGIISTNCTCSTVFLVYSCSAVKLCVYVLHVQCMFLVYFWCTAMHIIFFFTTGGFSGSCMTKDWCTEVSRWAMHSFTYMYMYIIIHKPEAEDKLCCSKVTVFACLAWWSYFMHTYTCFISFLQVMPYSTSCRTPLSNFESNQNYKETVDPAGALTCYSFISDFQYIVYHSHFPDLAVLQYCTGQM